MPRYFNDPKRAQFSLSFLRSIMRHSIIVIFLVGFSLQQIQAYSFQPNKLGPKYNSSIQPNSTQKQVDGFYLTTAHEHVPIAMEMEVVEDESEQSTEDASYANLSQKHTSEELCYNCIIRSRYLQLAFSAQQHPAVPFFILHHSWKNYIA